MLVAGGLGLAAGVTLLGAAPSTFTARALVGPATGSYDGPIERLVEQVLSPASLMHVVSACELPAHRSLVEVLSGTPAGAVERLDARLEPRGAPIEGVVVETDATTREAAIRAADLLAARLIAADAEHRGRALGGVAAPSSTRHLVGASPSAAAPGSGPGSAPRPAARLLLEQLRLRHPLLRDAEAERRLQTLAARLSDDRVDVAGLAAHLDGLEAEGERLERLIREEAARLWRLDRAERQELAARRTRSVPSPETPGAPASSSSSAASTSRVAELEAELGRLRASRTTLHPDVRRLTRLLESERQRVSSRSPAPADARQAEGSSGGAPHAVELRTAAAPLDREAPLLLPIADGPPALDAPPGDGPEAWTQRAPSYPTWIEARARAEEIRLTLDAREQQHAARQREHDLLARQLQQLEGPRLEEAALLERVAADEEAARQAARQPASSAVEPQRHGPPLLLLQAAGIHSERSPWRHLGVWALASVLLPLLGGLLLELRDRSVRGVEDLEGLGAPILGVVPHLRGR